MNFLLFFALTLSTVKGCGISTHTEIGHRALEYFLPDMWQGQYLREILLMHQDAFQAGQPYPDSFYNSLCYDGIYHGESEDTHWGKFVKVSFDYVNANYPQPWDENVEKLVAFLFGIISHQVADISWHGLQGLSEGFIPVLGNLNFGGSYEDAHDHADLSSDMIGIFEWNVTEYALEWYVPVQDLVAIYQIYYGDNNRITEDLVNECAGMLLIGRVGEQIIGKYLYPELARKSPAMVENFKEYFLGGLDDMTAWTTLVWNQAATALFNGTENCNIPTNTLGLNCENDKDLSWVSDIIRKNGYIKPADLSGYTYLPTSDDLEFQTQSTGTRLGMPTSKVEEALKMARDDLSSTLNKKITTDNSLTRADATTRFLTSNSYSRLGHSVELVDINSDSLEDIVIGAPGVLELGSFSQGCVYVILGKESWANPLPQGDVMVEEAADIIKCGNQVYGRFGSSLAIIDIDQDGIKDLIIGEPSTGTASLDYNGAVHVFLGIGYGTEYQLEESVIIKCSEKNCNLGQVMVTDNVNGDGHDYLVLGAPMADGEGGVQRGAILLLYSDLGIKWRNITELLIPDETGWDLVGEQDYERLGSSVAITKELLVVGSPGYRICVKPDCGHDDADLQSAGRVHVIKDYVKTMEGKQIFGGLGASVAITEVNIHGALRQVVAVGESSANSEGLAQTGRVILMEISGSNESGLIELASFHGNSELGKLGMQMEHIPGIGLVIAAPYAGLYVDKFGKVYVIDEHRELPGGDITSHCGFASIPCPDMWSNAVLASMEGNSLFGSALSGYNRGDKMMLAVGAERSNKGARMAGAVYLYNMEM